MSTLPKRATRGLRMTKLLEDEDSADEDFWAGLALLTSLFCGQNTEQQPVWCPCN